MEATICGPRSTHRYNSLDLSDMDPLRWLENDRARAHESQDAHANLCALATVDSHNQPQMRTLVLRDLDDRLAIFVNATSPKWPAMDRVAVMVYLASLGVQYRLNCDTEPMPAATVKQHWQLRPAIPKRLDWLYERHNQSSELASREQLLAALAAVSVPTPLVAPESARGLYLKPHRIERLNVNHANGVHDRRRWQLMDGRWHEHVLVP